MVNACLGNDKTTVRFNEAHRFYKFDFPTATGRNQRNPGPASNQPDKLTGPGFDYTDLILTLRLGWGRNNYNNRRLCRAGKIKSGRHSCQNQSVFLQLNPDYFGTINLIFRYFHQLVYILVKIFQQVPDYLLGLIGLVLSMVDY